MITVCGLALVGSQSSLPDYIRSELDTVNFSMEMKVSSVVGESW